MLLPLFLGIFQLALVLHVRNTLTSAAAEGARYAATLGAPPEDGRQKAQEQIDGAVSEEFADDITIERVSVAGAPAYKVTIRAEVAGSGLGGPGVAAERLRQRDHRAGRGGAVNGVGTSGGAAWSSSSGWGSS